VPERGHAGFGPGRIANGPPGPEFAAPTGTRGPKVSGGHDLMVVTVDPVAQRPSDRAAVGGRDRDGPHDLADLALATEQVALRRHPAPDVVRVRVELERSGIDRRRVGPVGRPFRGDDVEDVDPPGRPGDHLEAAVAAPRDVVVGDGRDPDVDDLHARDGSAATGCRAGVASRLGTLGCALRPHRLEAYDATLSRGTYRGRRSVVARS